MNRLAIILLIFFTILVSCNKKNEKNIIDRSGRNVVINRPVERIVSTAPSNTEIIADLGMAHKLAAIDHHSADIEGVPTEIPHLDFFFPDAEVLIMCEPDIIIASGHNPTGTGEDPFRLLREMGIPVVYIPMSKSIEDIYRDIEFIAFLLQADKEAEMLINSMKAQIDRIANAAFQKTAIQPSVYFEFSPAPDMMTFGKDSFINDMITIIGARNIFENETWLVTPGAEAVIERNPDIIFTNVNWIDDPVKEIAERPGFNHINAVKNNKVYYIDNNSSVRASARIVLALQQMAEAVSSD